MQLSKTVLPQLVSKGPLLDFLIGALAATPTDEPIQTPRPITPTPVDETPTNGQVHTMVPVTPVPETPTNGQVHTMVPVTPVPETPTDGQVHTMVPVTPVPETPTEGPTQTVAAATPTQNPPTPTATATAEPTPTATVEPTPTATATLAPTPTEEPGLGDGFEAPLELTAAVEAYGGVYQDPTFYAEGDFIQLSGLIRLPENLASNTTLGYIPEGYCPQDREIFLGNRHLDIARLDITSDCEIIYVHTGSGTSWVSLSNIRYHIESPNGATRQDLELDDRVGVYGGNYGTPYVSVENNRVTFGALIDVPSNLSNNQVIATLPPELCPAVRKVFSVAAGNEVARLDILPDCNIQWSGGVATPNWISLSGMSYLLDTEGNTGHVSLLGTASSYDGYGKPQYSIQDGMIHLSGLVKTATSWVNQVTFARIPKEYAPKERLIFTVNQHDATARVDVFPNGELQFIAGVNGRNWISFEDISWKIEESTSGFIDLADGVGIYSNSYQYSTPRWQRLGSLVILSGLSISTGSGFSTDQHLGTLPEGACPAHREVFAVNQNEFVAYVEVTEDCEINLVGDAEQLWLPFNGMAFQVRDNTFLNLSHAIQTTTALTTESQEYPMTYTHSELGTLTVSAQLYSDSPTVLAMGTVIGTLPAGRCPEDRHIFSVPTDVGTVRVDILNDCSIIWNSPDATPSWISLSGLRFPLTSTQISPITYGSNTTAYGGGYATPGSYGSLTATGLLGLNNKNSTWGANSIVGTLAAAHCPSGRQIFNVTSGSATARVDVHSDCSVTVPKPVSGSTWLSYDGILY